MNKVIIALLAACIVSAQAFVRREAEAPTTESAVAPPNGLMDLANKIKETLSPENIKSVLDKVNEDTKKFIDNMTKKKE